MEIRIKKESLASWPSGKHLVNPQTQEKYIADIKAGIPHFTVPEWYGQHLLSVSAKLFEKSEKVTKKPEKKDVADFKNMPYRKKQKLYGELSGENPFGVAEETIDAFLEKHYGGDSSNKETD